MTSDSLVLLLLVVASLLTWPFAILIFHRYLEQRYDVPSLFEILEMLVHRAEEPSSLKVLFRRLRRGMRDAYTGTLSRKKRLNTVHTVRMAPVDLDLVVDTIGIPAFCQDYADAYDTVTLKGAFETDQSGPWAIYVVGDPTCPPNRPRISAARPPGHHDAYFITPAARLTIKFESPARAKAPAAPAYDATKPFATGIDGAGSSATPTTTRFYEEPTSFLPDAAAQDAGGRDLTERFGLFQDGKLVARLSTSPFNIGRGDLCDLRLDDPAISRQHATLERRSISWVLVPGEGRLCSINGDVVTSPTALFPGDVLSFSRNPARFEFHG